MVVQFIVFLTISTLIYRGTDVSKCFSESVGILDNESRLYLLKMLISLQADLDLDMSEGTFSEVANQITKLEDMKVTMPKVYIRIKG